MKTNFDKTKVKERKFPKGDLVLAYFPIIGSPLQSRFHVNNNTYVKKKNSAHSHKCETGCDGSSSSHDCK